MLERSGSRILGAYGSLRSWIHARNGVDGVTVRAAIIAGDQREKPGKNAAAVKGAEEPIRCFQMGAYTTVCVPDVQIYGSPIVVLRLLGFTEWTRWRNQIGRWST
jgi:hypothetical protein